VAFVLVLKCNESLLLIFANFMVQTNTNCRRYPRSPAIFVRLENISLKRLENKSLVCVCIQASIQVDRQSRFDFVLNFVSLTLLEVKLIL